MEHFHLIESYSEGTIQVRVKGTSGRHYEVKAKQQEHHPGLSANSNMRRKTWSTSVIGAAWKKDIEAKDSNFTVSLCLNINEKKNHLPIGDKLASLALSLRNDIELAMDIALVAQFIVCPRNKLEHIFTFQDEMVVTQDMIDMSDQEEEEMDWEEEEEYYNSIEFEDLHEHVEFPEPIVDNDLDTESSNSVEMVDLIMRTLERREDRRSRGSS